jgi:23S rRNA pseudouridine1911/1915/1917 synthase
MRRIISRPLACRVFMTVPAVLFEDNHCLAVAKPGGLLTQGVPAGLPTLEQWVKDYLRTRYHKPGNVYLGVPHRLDRPVSGVVLFARNSKAAARLAEQFQQHQVEKVYWAIVAGDLPQPDGPWTDWLRKVPDEARVEAVEPDAPGGKEAVLDVRVLANREAETWLELRPRTGRTHQLRIQTALRGYPIQGDELYGSNVLFGPRAELPRDRTIALHARSLTFLHPIRYEPVTVTAELPDYWPEPPFDCNLEAP